MIKNIRKLKDFGIFKMYKNSEVKDFKKYNLFFGYNASGKSTLVHLLHCIEKRELSDRYPSAEFTIKHDNGEITQNNINQNILNIRTFNRDFINENVSMEKPNEKAINSILLLDERKIADREKLKELKKVQEDDDNKYQENKAEITKLGKFISELEAKIAKKIKMDLHSIDARYINYDKRNLEKFITHNTDAIKSKKGLLDHQQITELIQKAKPDEKREIPFSQESINYDFVQAKSRLDNLLKTSVVNKTIQRLSENGDIQTWVERGLKIHKENETSQCEFCRNEITKERLEELEAHFNDEYRSFKTCLESELQQLNNLDIASPQLPARTEFYEELQPEYIEADEILQESQRNLTAEIKIWKNILEKKIGNPFQTDLSIDSITEQVVEKFNRAITTINGIVNKHNKKTNNFQEVTNEAKKQLELHYATEAVNQFYYFGKKQEMDNLEERRKEINKRCSTREKEISVLEGSLSNEILGAERFNKSLHSFIGHSELTLRFSQEKKGYEILRNGTVPKNDVNLSEGEKTAIAFVYFITKLKENNNDIKDTVIVIDDPVSSFDSNHLLGAYSFLKENCKDAKQLFVLTHNLPFFNFVRGWFSGKNSKNGVNRKANFYVVEANKDMTRNAKFMNAPNILEKYSSEYHYIFYKLYSLKQDDSKTLGIDEGYFVANLARKLLETFFRFKFPKNQDFHALLKNGESGKFDEARVEKIYKFVNKYSHATPFENEEFIENLMGEAPNVISDIFEWIKERDEGHYEEMKKLVSEDSRERKEQPASEEGITERSDHTGH